MYLSIKASLWGYSNRISSEMTFYKQVDHSDLKKVKQLQYLISCLILRHLIVIEIYGCHLGIVSKFRFLY